MEPKQRASPRILPGPGPGSLAVADWLETYNLDALKETIYV